jgi:hypothetical protein
VTCDASNGPEAESSATDSRSAANVLQAPTSNPETAAIGRPVGHEPNLPGTVRSAGFPVVRQTFQGYPLEELASRGQKLVALEVIVEHLGLRRDADDFVHTGQPQGISGRPILDDEFR